MLCIWEALKQHTMGPGPDASLLPIMQAPLTGHAGAAQFTGQHLPLRPTPDDDLFTVLAGPLSRPYF
jgi:hypothetical protein